MNLLEVEVIGDRFAFAVDATRASSDAVGGGDELDEMSLPADDRRCLMVTAELHFFDPATGLALA